MKHLLKQEFRFLAKPLSLASRLWLLAGVAALIASFFVPLWEIHLVAPQYAEGLNLDIYSYQIAAGNNGQDLKEINQLNHYIGMKPLHEADFLEMKWIPFALGFFMLFTLRAAVFGMMRYVIDLLMLFIYFGAFSMGSFAYRLYTYGHVLDPKAAVTIEPFMPVLIGTQQIANFRQSSLPQLGSLFLGIYALSLMLAIWYSRKETL
ncbi:MAG TPA: hypothetical protein VNQ90_09705 [Chthoniobacteraceae bacterium]|nr:hypothetical protein [Chthoniobacteraceae bacterium]